MFRSFMLRASGAAFVNPLEPAPRTAILVPGFKSKRNTRVFPDGWNRAAAEFEPAAVAGTFDQLLALADHDVRLTHAVICLAWDVDDLLSEQQRDALWSALGVPIFEQFLGPGNVILAHECAAHAGLHTTLEYSGRSLDTGICACGSTAPLLVTAAAQFC